MPGRRKQRVRKHNKQTNKKTSQVLQTEVDQSEDCTHYTTLLHYYTTNTLTFPLSGLNRELTLYLVARLLAVVDLLQRDGARRKEVTQFGQIDAVPEPLLQLCGGGQLLVQAGLHPPVGGAHRTRDVALHSLASETTLIKLLFTRTQQDA